MEQRQPACDACRRRRVKCDTTQPCGTCARSRITCTYGSAASRVSATSYARNLEQQVAELQRQVELLTNSASASPLSQTVDLLIEPGDDLVLRQSDGVRVYKYSAALNVLRSIANMVGSVPAATPSPNLPGQALVEILETPLQSPSRQPLDWLGALLPSSEAVWIIITYALDNALMTHDCIDRAGFKTRLDDFLQDTINAKFEDSKPFIALVYALLALGERYRAMDDYNQRPDEAHSRGLRGANYFHASCSILHEDQQRYDLDTVTAFLLISRYLLSTSTFSDARAALNSAVSVAMHMGLHLDDSSRRRYYTETQLYDRRLVFAVMNMIDTYLAWPLGLPRLLPEANTKQILGLRDADLLDEGDKFISENPYSPQAVTVLNQKLLRILAKISARQSDADYASTAVTDWIPPVEAELKEWEGKLPELSHSSEYPQILLAHLHLRVNFAAGQIQLYAPFLHHLARDRSEPAFNLTGYDYASNGVRVSMQLVALIETIFKQNMLKKAHWLNTYSLAWAATVLAYFVVHSRTRVTVKESRDSALKANYMLEALGSSNQVARRIHETLSPLMDTVSSLE